jgi:hypothetical protein
MKETSETTSKYGRGDTQAKLAKQWKESQEDIKMAKSGVACDRLVALQRFKEEYAERKKRRLQEEVRNVELFFSN